MLEPLQIFLYNWECIELSLVAEAEATKDAQKNAAKKQPEIDFDDWMKNVMEENAGNYKEEKYGIKKKKGLS